MQAQYLIVLCTFKEQLQQHVRVHAVEAVMACRDIESTLQALTGTLSFVGFFSKHRLRNSIYLLSDSFVGFNYYYANKRKASLVY